MIRRVGARAPLPVEKPKTACVVVVDDDDGVRSALESLFRSVDHSVWLVEDAQQLLELSFPDVPTCIVLDVRLRGSSGLEVAAQLRQRGTHVPVVFMTGYGDIQMSVAAMKAGAVDFLAKPFRDQDMLDAVMAALDRDKLRRDDIAIRSNLQARFDALTPREREVMKHVTSGLMNKQIADEVGLSEITVKIHRGTMMRKMEARSVADLVRQAEALGVQAR